MKKSKVLVPAMALLLFSTAASITGTVAWFSSTRVFTSQAGKFSVAQLEGNLACTVTPGIATAASGDNITFNANTALGDASFNATSKLLYTDVADTETFRSLGAWALSATGDSAGWQYGTANGITYYYAATWKYTFTYTFMAEQTDMNLYFDVNKSVSTFYKTDGTEAGDEAVNTAQGFRMAFVSDTNKKVVWAPFRAQEPTGDEGNPTIRYVSSTDSDLGTFDSVVLLDKTAKASDTYALGTAADSKAANLDNCIGTFDVPDHPGNVTIEVEMTAWYEGTDPAIVTNGSTKMQQVSATLPFTVRAAA